MLKKHIFTVMTAAALVGCGGGSGGGDVAEDLGKDRTGQFSHDVEGLRYTSVAPNGVLFEGRTGRWGVYRYAQGDTVTFFAGDFPIGSIEARPYVSPAHFDLAVVALDYSLPEVLDLSDIECPQEGQQNEEPAPEPTPVPIQCEPWYPEEGLEERTMQVLAFLDLANIDTLSTPDKRIIIGRRDEAVIAEDLLSGQGNLPGNMDMLRFLSELSLAPRAGTYPQAALPQDDSCPVNGEVSINVGYASGGQDRSGSLYIKSIDVWREDLGTVVKMLPSQMNQSRHLYPSFNTEFATQNYTGQLSLAVALTDQSQFEGSFTWTDSNENCSGAIGVIVE
ncbi:hypothetical protein [Marinimicrobium sp. ABcell2]|uniref:hypothetical protein n=1 Tax=Marinimicrobium sp. ABcell2 TaxID=3069751 RepID=UPI0027AFB61D|nr:hypothetical protein [Marinimicrobium sp. ABcell2]MDQ2077425.1 hypothetical protein [Marinimicrobium sp. ABcell2]